MIVVVVVVVVIVVVYHVKILGNVHGLLKTFKSNVLRTAGSF